MPIVIVALAVALVVVAFLYLKNKDGIREQEGRVREFQQAAERVKQQQANQEFQHKREISEVQKQKDEDRQRIEAIYKQQINAISDKEAELQQKLTDLQAGINKLAQAQCQEWIQNQCEIIKKEQGELARREAEALLEQWIFDNKQKIGQESIKKAQAVTLGKVTEHFIPFLPGFNFNPKDARFLGSPIDYIVFDGMDEGEIRKIVIVEVKSGAATLTKRQRQIRDAINSHRVEWKSLGLEEAKQLQEEMLFQTVP